MSQLILPPSVFTKTASPEMSRRYVHIDSEAIVRDMEQQGFVVASVNTIGGRRKSVSGVFSRHVIDFRHPDAPQIGDATPRVLFGNSHDGSTKAFALAGVFRFVCSNGMVVGSTYAQEKVLHVGDAARGLIERMRALSKNTAPLFKQIDTWSKKQLTTPQSREFARMAAQLRWGDAERFKAEDLLQVRRPEDDRGDLWTVFNRVQEATTRGGDHITGLTRTGRVTRAHAINAPGTDVRFNAQLWQLAEEFCEVV